MIAEPSSQNERVLVVEDEADLGNTVAYALRASGYDAQVADRGESALGALQDFSPDLILLDLMLPDMSGLDVCRKVRSRRDSHQPAIIMVTARAEEVDRVVGFEVGADDYVVKPFSVRELMLRIQARLKARKAALGPVNADQPSDDGLSLHNLRVDTTAHRVFVGESEVHVSALEMKLLVELFRAPGRMLTRRQLLTKVWGYHPDVASRTVDTHMKRLRDKLGEAAPLLQTVRGVGFRLSE
jgi:two-component system phosphate regulon response regulator PhoB